MEKSTLEKIVDRIGEFEEQFKKTDFNTLTMSECEKALATKRAFEEVAGIIEGDL